MRVGSARRARASRIWVADADGGNATGAVPGEHRPPVDHRRVPHGRRAGLHCARAGRRPAGLAPRTSPSWGRPETFSPRALSATRSLTTAAWACAPLTTGSRSRRTARASRTCVPATRARIGNHRDRHPGRRDRRGRRARRDARERPGRIQRSAGLVSGRQATPRSPAIRSASRPPTTAFWTRRPSWWTPTAATFVSWSTRTLFARDAAWSPDGSTIAFTSAIAWLGVDQFGQARELQRGQRRLHGARRRLGCSATDELRADARGPWRARSGRWPRGRLDPRRADRVHPAQVGRRGRFDESAARGLDHGRRWCERAAARWVEPGSPERGRVRGLPVPAGRRRTRSSRPSGDPRRDVRPLRRRSGPPRSARTVGRAAASRSTGQLIVEAREVERGFPGPPLQQLR